MKIYLWRKKKHFMEGASLLFLSSICFLRFSENPPFGPQWSSNKRKNFSDTEPTIFNRKVSEKYTILHMPAFPNVTFFENRIT